jgi:hypothetical protein
MPANQWLSLLLFMTLLLALSLGGLAASGHFPREHRAPALASSVGSIVLFGSIAVGIACLIVGIVHAWSVLPWYAAIIGGGLVLLATPLLLQPLPDSFVNGRAALLAFAGTSVLLLLVMLYAS